MNIAVILAGGSGLRMRNVVPKQFVEVAGRPIIEHTLMVFEMCPAIDEICIVSNAAYVSRVEAMVDSNGHKKVTKVLCGGRERFHSSWAAINAYTDDNANLLFHDAVRPLVTQRIIGDCLRALETYNAVDVAVKTVDTIVTVDSQHCIDRIPDRNMLYNSQTPQCFKRRTIDRAYKAALNHPTYCLTDDCGVVRKFLPNEKIFVVDGENFNIKLTYKEDLFLIDKLLTIRQLEAEKQERCGVVSLQNNNEETEF